MSKTVCTACKVFVTKNTENSLAWKRKKFDLRPLGVEPGPTDSESDVLTTRPSIHMALTRDQPKTHAIEACILIATRIKINKRLY